MVEFRDLNQMFAYMNDQLIIAMEKTAEEVQQIMQDYIQSNLYDSYQPSEYIRTYDYLNSLSVKKVRKENGWNVVEIFFDPEKIKQNEVEGFWNQHMSAYGYREWKGTQINELIPMWLEEGVESPLFSRKGIHVVDETIKELEQTKIHLQKIKEILLQKGIQVEFN
jgi:hypothetical protein